MSTISVSNAGMDTVGVEITDFYQQYRQPLLAYLTRIVRNRDTAEELCQDSFVKVLRHWPQRNQQQDVRAWLYRIAKNTAYDEMRRWRRRPSVRLSETCDIIDEQSDVERQVSEAVAIRIALAQLPAHERVPLTMQLYENRKLNEIAAATGTPVNTVKTRLRRARAHFQAVYHG
ncbi:MAG TPA: RNA polymerase sigma factor [Roseiflexaceae bacterium]|nr:RNA polymerase sigma factor [Roseiflexaceae bacterium]